MKRERKSLIFDKNTATIKGTYSLLRTMMGARRVKERLRIAVVEDSKEDMRVLLENLYRYETEQSISFEITSIVC